jgi:hypothetical protein
MLVDVCSILLAAVAVPISSDPHETLKRAWFTGVISDNGIRPLEAELLRDSNNVAYVPKEFRDGTAPMAGGGMDCTPQMVGAGLTMGPWPQSSTRNGMSASPNGQPAITFNPLRLSNDGNYVLVSWVSTLGPTASVFVFAILERRKSGWEITRVGSFGPVS